MVVPPASGNRGGLRQIWTGLFPCPRDKAANSVWAGGDLISVPKPGIFSWMGCLTYAGTDV
jgi:hypothetical protein